MGNSPAIPKRPPVPAGKTRICVTGFGISHNVGRAYHLASLIATSQPDKYETWYHFTTFGFKSFLETIKSELPDNEKSKQSTTDKGTTVAHHHSAPFVWFETGGTNANAETGTVEGKTYDVKGGCDMFRAWAQKEFPDDSKIQELASTPPKLKDSFFNNKDAGTWQKQ